jgi:hypothetical protein
VRLVADPEVCGYVSEHGGVLWLRTTRQRCCFGALTSLRAGTSRPEDADNYRLLDTGLPIDVRFLGTADRPDELTVELRGARRRRLIALWDGCKFKV